MNDARTGEGVNVQAYQQRSADAKITDDDVFK